MKAIIMKNCLLICLILSTLSVIYFNISGLLVGHDIMQTVKFLGATNDTALAGITNILLFAFIIIRFNYRKTNLFWIFLLYLGPIIFSLTKLFERNNS